MMYFKPSLVRILHVFNLFFVFLLLFLICLFVCFVHMCSVNVGEGGQLSLPYLRVSYNPWTPGLTSSLTVHVSDTYMTFVPCPSLA